MESIKAGSAWPLGATCQEEGVNFAIFSGAATRVEVALYDRVEGSESARHVLPARTGSIWHGWLPAQFATSGTYYAFHVDGTSDARSGARFDPGIALIDPYARALSGGLPQRSRVVDDAFDWRGDRSPHIAWRDSIIYELHVKGFTQLHPEVPQAWRGKYLGLTVPSVIEHLRYLGVTAVELLPCQAFASEVFLAELGLTNYWGYNSVAWFAPATEYAVTDAVIEFKTMVQALHAADIEVILDVVFNHTAEGNEKGPVLNLKGIDNAAYYRLSSDYLHYENFTGCGNTVNCEHPQVRTLIVDCLRYWAEKMHVDGFRFDLAPVLARNRDGFNEHSSLFEALRADTVLKHVKLIAEPWDVGWAGYQLGRFPPGWSEWNDRFRDTARSFWRRDPGRVGELAERFAGSSDLFQHNGRKPTANINYVTSHDGFTLHDLVSYNERHNEANLESNADGTGNNLSWNCGAEGVTEDGAILALRKRQIRNLLATLILSQGVPMLLGGDELLRSQKGNNNAYCQDNELSWVDWRLLVENTELVSFVRLLIKIRGEHPEFRRETFLKGVASPSGVKDVSWLHLRGGEMTHTDWQDSELRTLGILLGNRNNTAHRLLLMLNADAQDQAFGVPPAAAGSPWICRFDTGREHAAVHALRFEQNYPLIASSAVLLEC